MLEVVAVLLRSGERFLLCQRPEQKAHGLLWEFAGGKVEPGETKRQALARECREELGVEIAVGEEFLELTHVYPEVTIHLTVFCAELRSGQPQALEHRALRWVTAEEAGRLPLSPADVPILRQVERLQNKNKLGDHGMKSKVYFTREITPEKVVEMLNALNAPLTGKVAAKVHSGEEGNQNFLHPEFWRPVVEAVGATVVECNTAYPGARNTTAKHKKLLEKHGWTKYFPVDLLDAEGSDLELPIPDGLVLKKNLVGKDIQNYDSMMVLSHFKGHPMGGYGGALKQLSIGCASSEGKCWIHSGGVSTDQEKFWDNIASQDSFCEAMADAAGSVVRYFNGKMAFLNVMSNLSVDCDCCKVAEDPCMKDIGILASLDPVAIDQACIDLVYASDDPGRAHMVERIESRHGVHTIEAAAKIGFGSREYELVEL